MNLDEAIQSFKDEMEKQTALGHSEHIDNLEQMSEWLKELKAYRELNGDAISRQAAISAIEVLDKIRAEIAELEEGISSYHNDRPWVFKDEVLQIIDKYKMESEGKE